MAKVHERLYQSKDLSSIKFAEYGMSLLNDLFSSHRASPRIRLKVTWKMYRSIWKPQYLADSSSMNWYQIHLKYAFSNGDR